MNAKLYLAAALLLCACSSPDTGADAGPSDAAQSAIDSGGSEDVLADVASSDIGADADADATTALPLTAANYCETTAQMFCDYYLRCGRMAAADSAECLSTFLESCNEVYEPRYQSFEERGLLTLSQEGFEACQAHLATVQCEQQLFDLDGGCAGMWRGLAAQGAACAPGIGSFVCEPETVCTLGLDFCGTCEPAAAVGATCGDGVRCVTGAQCVDGTCVQRALPGEACDDAKPCITGASCEAGVCRGFDVVAVGQACDQAKRCPYKAACRGSVCVESALLGESCVDRECASGYCADGTCRQFLAPGAPCTTANECLSLVCESGTCGELERNCFE